MWYWIQWKANQIGLHHRPYRLWSHEVPHPLWCRPNSSDRDVFNQVFLAKEYGCLHPDPRPVLIVDCGANVGHTSAFLLSRFPQATVIAIEPDPANCALLRRNLGPYGERVRIVASAVWSGAVGLLPSETPFGDGREWARQVREALPHELPAMIGVEMGALLKQSGFDRIAILKVDIEGAEKQLFGPGVEAWIDRVDQIAVELHDTEAIAIFETAIAGRGFVTSRFGELTMGYRPTTARSSCLKPPSAASTS